MFICFCLWKFLEVFVQSIHVLKNDTFLKAAEENY